MKNKKIRKEYECVLLQIHHTKNMAEISIKIINEIGEIVAQNTDFEEVNLVYQKEYQAGDKIIITTSEINKHYFIQVDDALGGALVYIKKNELTYAIPFAEKRLSYSPKIFTGNIHLLSVRLSTKEEIQTYRNLAVNVMDAHGDTGCYPHASANVETRGESVFAARNAIDGVTENHSHGIWPYESWGINMQDDAEFRLDFGRKVVVDKIKLYTRSDFPHDNWWREVTFTFSDGTTLVCELEKSDKAHIIEFEKKEIEWLLFHKLIKADDPSPFPALSQIQVYGVEA